MIVAYFLLLENADYMNAGLFLLSLPTDALELVASVLDCHQPLKFLKTTNASSWRSLWTQKVPLCFPWDPLQPWLLWHQVGSRFLPHLPDGTSLACAASSHMRITLGASSFLPLHQGSPVAKHGQILASRHVLFGLQSIEVASFHWSQHLQIRRFYIKSGLPVCLEKP